MSEENLAEIKKLIDSMQSGLVELFDQLRELRRLLGSTDESPTSDSLTSSSLFSEISPSTPTEATAGDIDTTDDEPLTDSGSSIVVDETVSLVLDPITNELQSSDAPADVIAGYVQAAKDFLIKEESSNNKVAHDMDVVLKFLHARGTKGIRPKERDNILKRIKRWKVHLSAHAES
ncbi:MAG: hypothetical protein AM324_000690 [Candidatus Thorarchaeota archaeon SMTZ1-83]|nr:MAG: hypothetical protein AM324_01435 [Candidatus Thorarchaeota archaeon SMTZ1-83]